MNKMKFLKIPLSELKKMKKLRLDNCVPSNDAHYDTIVAYIHPNPLVRWIFWKRLKLMLMLSLKAERVLDFGSGSGVFLYSLCKNFKEVYGLDVATKSMNYIKKKFKLNNLKIIKNRGEKLPFKDRFFDIVYAADVLEHMDNPQIIYQELNRIIKPGGCLIVSGPTENLIYELAKKIIFRRKSASEHYYNIDNVINETSKFFTIEKIKIIPLRIIAGFKIFRAINNK
jgi:2-polyprenyl-3-methyl-5-hydroxy-6-metoxy-1,4-benzoquinol methylase